MAASLEFDHTREGKRRVMERMIKLQDVILKAMPKKISWMEAAEIAGHGPDDAVNPGTVSGIRLYRTVRSKTREEKQAPDSDANSRGSVAAVPESVFRLEHAALSREAAGGA